jgi:hypothetical protein
MLLHWRFVLHCHYNLQIDASKVAIGRRWQPVLQEAVAEAARALDISDASAAAATNIEAAAAAV